MSIATRGYPVASAAWAQYHSYTNDDERCHAARVGLSVELGRDYGNGVIVGYRKPSGLFIAPMFNPDDTPGQIAAKLRTLADFIVNEVKPT